MIYPRLAWAFLFALAVVSSEFFIARPVAAKTALLNFRRHVGVVLVALFIFYAALSALWSVEPKAIAAKMAGLVAIFVAAGIVFLRATFLVNDDRSYVLRGILVGYCIGLAYFAVEIFTNGAIAKPLLNIFGGNLGLVDAAITYTNGKVSALATVAFNRHAISVCLFLWAPLLFLLPTKRGDAGWKTVTAIVVLTAAAASLFCSINESAKLALVAGLLFYAMAKISSKFAVIALAAAWVMSTLFVIPAVYVADSAGLQDKSWVQHSGRERLKIWKANSDSVWHSPIFGIGARSTQYLDEQAEKGAMTEAQIEAVDAKNARYHFPHHSHNGFLQTWYELGIVGALLLCGLGLALLQAIRQRSERFQPIMSAHFASFAVILGLSYGLWQTWYQATILIAFLATQAATTSSPKQ